MNRRELLEENWKDLEFMFRRYFRKMSEKELTELDIKLCMIEEELREIV